MVNKKIKIIKTNLIGKCGIIIAANLSSYTNNKFIILLDGEMQNGDKAVILHKDCFEIIE